MTPYQTKYLRRRVIAFNCAIIFIAIVLSVSILMDG